MLQILQHTTEARFHPHPIFINLLNPTGSRRPGKDRVGGDSTGTRDHEDRRTVRSINIEWCEVPTFQNVHNV